jgi:hypothetical protein
MHTNPSAHLRQRRVRRHARNSDAVLSKNFDDKKTRAKLGKYFRYRDVHSG